MRKSNIAPRRRPDDHLSFPPSPFQEARYLVDHARRQRKRRKNPSESGLGERNPRKALELARKVLADTYKVDSTGGISYDTVGASVDAMVTAREKKRADGHDHDIKRAIGSHAVNDQTYGSVPVAETSGDELKLGDSFILKRCADGIVRATLEAPLPDSLGE